MFSYKDQSFCNSDCINDECFRHWGEKDKQKAAAANMPVAFADHSWMCSLYKPPETDDA